MDWFRTQLSRCAAMFGKRRLDAELEEELRLHVELAIEEHMALGMSHAQARTAAMKEFGGITQIAEQYRVKRGLPLLEEGMRDIRFGLRQLYRSPGFAATAVLTLALGLGANTAVFSLINSLLLRPLPVPHADELAVLKFDRSDFESSQYYFCAPMFRALEKRKDVFQNLAAFSSATLQVRNGNRNEEVPGALVSGQFFRVLEIAPLMGRFLGERDDEMGSPGGYAVVISESFWHSWFNGAPDVVGRPLRIANASFTVVGVMPAKFIGADPTERPNIYVPLSAEPITDAPYNNIADGYQSWWLKILARRKPGISQEQANAALAASTNGILTASMADASWMKDAQAGHIRLGMDAGSRGYNELRTTFQKPMLVVFSLCGAVLLLACLNLASLLMARAAARERELATRLAIGATRGRLVRQLLVESLLIATLGTAAGLAVTPVASHLLAALLIGSSHTTVLNTSLDLRLFAFAALVTVVAALLIGLLPALRATSGELNTHMKNGGQTRSSHSRRHWLPQVLMGSEVALALMLVVGAGLLATSLTRLYRTGLGFDPKGVVGLNLSMEKQSLKGPALLRWYQEYADALRVEPGVESVSYQAITPLSGSIMKSTFHTSAKSRGESLFANTVGPNYFATMHIPLLMGRDFRWSDVDALETAGQKIVLNQSAAKVLFPGRSALGQTVLGYKDKPYEVIGMVGDVHYTSIRDTAPPTVYRPIQEGAEDKMSFGVVLRLRGRAAPLAAAVRSLTTRMAPEIPMPPMTTMSSQLDDSIRSERMMAMLSVFFAACALLVTAIGLYGTLAYATARRTSEIGIRMALGAQRPQVVGLVFRENAAVAAGGAIAGLGAAMLASRALASFLYGTSVRDPWVLLGSVVALALIASAASLLPALRAARIEPMTALRSE